MPAPRVLEGMIEFFLSGGFIMFVVLVLGVWTLVVAARFAKNASQQGLALVRALTIAQAFTAVAGVAMDIATVCRGVTDTPEWLKEPVPYLLQGLNESLSPIVLAAPLVAIAWILVAFGVRRMPRE